MSVKHSPERPERIEYRRPVLAVYGTVHDRTLNNVSNNMNDKQSGSQDSRT